MVSPVYDAAMALSLRRFAFRNPAMDPTGMRERGEAMFREDGYGRSRHLPLEVTVDGRGIESALRLFKRLVLKDGLLRQLKRRSHYEKPGERKRRKVREAARRLRRQKARAEQREKTLTF